MSNELYNSNKTVYELWLSSFSLDNKTYEIDKLLFNYYHNLNWIKKWKLVNLNLNYEIKTKLKLEITTELATKNEKKNQQKVLNYNLLNINVKYKWPKLLTIQNQEPVLSNKQPENSDNIIRFPLTQVGSFEVKNITLSNPSNQHGLLIQLLFIYNYPVENNKFLLEMLKNSNYDLGIDEYLDDIQNDGNKKKEVNAEDLFTNDSVFSFHYHKLANQGIVPLTKGGNKYSKQNSHSKNNLSFFLQKSQQVTLQIQFQPFKKQIFSTILLVRNNLTILDAYIIHGEGGSGELRLSNRKPNTKIPLIIEMTTKQYKHCEMIKNRQKDFYIENENENSEVIDNLTLKKSFKLKNHGNLNIFVHEIRIDKQKCSAYGFELGTCRNILLEPNQTYELDVKYQPDYTMSKIIKVLEFETNLGIFRYELHVKIPKTMLSACHQALPRPKFEKYFYYFAITLIIMFILILIVVAIFESRNILRYHFETQNNLNEEHQKQFNIQEFVSEYQLQSSYILNSQESKNQPTVTVNNNSSHTKGNKPTTIKQQFNKHVSNDTNTKTPVTQTASYPTTKLISKSSSTPRPQVPLSSNNSEHLNIDNQNRKQQLTNKKQSNKKDESTKRSINEIPTNLTSSSSSSNEQLNQQQAKNPASPPPSLIQNSKKPTTVLPPTPPPPPVSPSLSTSSSSSSPSTKQDFNDKMKLITTYKTSSTNNNNYNKKRKDATNNDELIIRPSMPNNNNKLSYNTNINRKNRFINTNDDEYDAKYTPPPAKSKSLISEDQPEIKIQETESLIKNDGNLSLKIADQSLFKIPNILPLQFQINDKYEAPSKFCFFFFYFY